MIHITAVEEATAERAIEPQSIALGVFGAIAALAALLIAGQAIGRQGAELAERQRIGRERVRAGRDSENGIAVVRRVDRADRVRQPVLRHHRQPLRRRLVDPRIGRHHGNGGVGARIGPGGIRRI